MLLLTVVISTQYERWPGLLDATLQRHVDVEVTEPQPGGLSEPQEAAQHTPEEAAAAAQQAAEPTEQDTLEAGEAARREAEADSVSPAADGAAKDDDIAEQKRIEQEALRIERERLEQPEQPDLEDQRTESGGPEEQEQRSQL